MNKVKECGILIMMEWKTEIITQVTSWFINEKMTMTMVYGERKLMQKIQNLSLNVVPPPNSV